MTQEQRDRVSSLVTPIWSVICDDIDKSLLISFWLKTDLKQHVIDFFDKGEPLSQKDTELLKRLYPKHRYLYDLIEDIFED